VEVDPLRRQHLDRRFEEDERVRILESVSTASHYDLIVISTPPKFHYDYYRKLEDCSNCFLIEKPMTLNADQAQPLMTSATAKAKKVFVNLVRRTLGSYKLVREFYKNNIFGKLRKVEVREGNIFNWPAASMGSFSRDLNGGGVLMDTGPHTIDLLFMIFDTMELVQSRMDAVDPAIEANCILNLIADDEIPVLLALSRNRVFSNEIVLGFDGAELRIGVRQNSIKVNLEEGVSFQMLPEAADLCHDGDFNSLVDKFYEMFLLQQKNDEVGPANSLKIARIIDAAYGNAQLITGGF
jgi:predicted dehydrogenase